MFFSVFLALLAVNKQAGRRLLEKAFYLPVVSHADHSSSSLIGFSFPNISMARENLQYSWEISQVLGQASVFFSAMSVKWE